jgi:hypothetical protein
MTRQYSRSGGHSGYSSKAAFSHETQDYTAYFYVPFTVEPYSPRCWEHDDEGGGVEFGALKLIDYRESPEDDMLRPEEAMAKLSPEQVKAIEALFDRLAEISPTFSRDILQACYDEPAPEPDYPEE